jgi:hypothetical protein
MQRLTTNSLSWNINTHSISKIAPSRASESFDGKNLSLFHLSIARVLNERNLLITVDLILLDIMPSNVADGFDGVGFASDFDLIALHDFLDRGAYITHACINSGCLYHDY